MRSPFRYCGAAGYQTSPDTGLMLAGNRWYDPQIGRFLTPDPSGSGDNPYVYAGNNPVSNLDPLGLDPGSVTSNDPVVAVVALGFAIVADITDDLTFGGGGGSSHPSSFGSSLHHDFTSKPTGLSSQIISAQYDLFMQNRFGHPGDFSTIAKVLLNPNGTPSFKMAAWAIGGSDFGRPADYMAFNVGFNFPATWAGVNGQVVVTQEHMYIGAGFSAGSPGFSASAVAGWLLGTTPPTSQQLDGFLSGLSINGSAGALLGGGFTYSPGAGLFDFAKYTGASETGYYSPQFGVNFTYDGRIW